MRCVIDKFIFKKETTNCQLSSYTSDYLNIDFSKHIN